MSRIGLLCIALWILPAACWGEGPLLRSNDRIVLVGGTIIEQMQRFGYFEALLQTRQPDLKLTVRNLGWSGDDASAMARKVFGDPNQGFARFVNDLQTASPTVVLVAYGTAEALDGMRGANGFEANLQRMLDEIERREARVVLVKPYRMTGAKRADYHDAYELVRGTLDKIAKAKGYGLIDPASALAAEDLPDGLHPQAPGHRKYAQALVDGLTGKATNTSLPELQFEAKPGDQRGSVRKTIELSSVPLPAAGEVTVRFKAKGLGDTQHEVRCGNWSKQYSKSELEAGIEVPVVVLSDAWRDLVNAVQEKDELFFHRHRPQNETYLFLFRKHEQGQNAVEIPQFDPLLEKGDQRIQALAKKGFTVEIQCD